VKRLHLYVPWAVLAAVLVVGVPLFVRMPVWVDVTYHDLSAWNILHGGVHYRDVFETNLPGMVWLHALIRPAVGWSHEAIRLVDLLVIGSAMVMATWILRRSGIAAVAQIWFLAAAALFYLFDSEFIHCQRDGWMLLPAIAATCLSVRRCDVAPRSAYWSVAEGLLWGAAVWIKPHVLVPALAVWIVSLRFQTRRGAIRDGLGLLSGGVVAGALGCWWLISTGTWDPMWDVLLNWNKEYYSWSWTKFWFKVRLVSAYFAPFSLVHFVAIPLGLVALFRRNSARATLAAIYLGWLAQATLIQKEFDYAHAPPTLLGLALLAAHRVPVGPIFLVWCLAAGLINEFAGNSEWLATLRAKFRITVATVLPHHGVAKWDRLSLWGRCWHDGSWQLKDRLTFFEEVPSAPNWTDLERVAEFLRTKGLKDRELICWHDSTHPLYVWLEIKPGIRYPHVITAMKFQSKREQIRRETFESPARYVVSDIAPIEFLNPLGPRPPAGPVDSLPPEFPEWSSDVYPWNQPVVFRAGRYFVHEVKTPRGEIIFPLPPGFWEQ
jgi:hypothetical protein